MLKWLKILLVGFLVSCFYFPVKYSFIPIANTKNLMAAVGLILVLVVLIRKQEFSFPRDLFVILIFAAAMSLISMLAITYNQTPDTTYVTYIRSAIIWLSGAFAVCYITWLAHKRVDVPLVVNYLAGVCRTSAAYTESVHPWMWAAADSPQCSAPSPLCWSRSRRTGGTPRSSCLCWLSSSSQSWAI